MRRPILTLTAVSYRYRSQWLYRPTTALHPLTLEVYEGESFGFLGHNGAGKTTTIKAILGLIKATSGSITIDGIAHTDPRCRERVGYLPEQPYFYDYLTVSEVMELYATLAGVSRSSRKGAIDEALEKVGMAHRSKAKMRALSKGLTQRVALAQAIVHRPSLLILDEPFSGLDPIGRKEFKNILLELRRTGTTIFMSSHILQDVEFLCDRASILVKGRLKGVYELRELEEMSDGAYELAIVSNEGNRLWAESQKIPFQDERRLLLFRFPDWSSGARTLRDAIESNVSIETFAKVRPSLEEIFVSLVKEEKVHEG